MLLVLLLLLLLRARACFFSVSPLLCREGMRSYADEGTFCSGRHKFSLGPPPPHSSSLRQLLTPTRHIVRIDWLTPPPLVTDLVLVLNPIGLAHRQVLEASFPENNPLLPSAGSQKAARVDPLLRLEREIFSTW